MASQLVPTTFEYFAERNHETVLIKGSWDRWQSFAALRRKEDNSNLWQVHMTLNPGAILFKFVVDNEWVCAPNYEHISDGFGGMNCALDIKPPKEVVSALPKAQRNDEPIDPDHSIPSTHASVTEVIDVDFHHHLHQSVPPVLHSPHKMSSSACEPSATEQELANEADGLTGKGSVPSEHATEAVQPVESKPETIPVTFEHPRDQSYDSVCIKGSWDGWKQISPLELSEEHDVWRTVLNLPAGIFLFKFIVDDHWTHCAQYEIQSDGFGGFNNVISVSASDSLLGNTSEPLHALDSALQPQEVLLDTGMLNIKEKEEDVRPVEELNTRDDEGNTIDSTSLKAQETAQKQTIAEQECETQTASEDKLVDSEKLEKTEARIHVSEVPEKLQPERESLGTESYQSPRPSAPKDENVESTNEAPSSETFKDTSFSRTKFESHVPLKDQDASSEEQENIEQPIKLGAETLSDTTENYEETIEDARSENKEKKRNDDRGCIIC